jgi:putative two-component system response regulator
MATNTELNIILLEDEPTDAELVERALRKGNLKFVTRRAENKAGFMQALSEGKPDIVLSDYKLPDFNGLAAVKAVREKYPDVPVIVVTGCIGDEAAVELIKSGANDYVLKDRLARLPYAVERALAEAAEHRERQRAQHALQQSLKSTIVALASTMELRDVYTAGHQRRVSELAAAIATEMGLPDKQIEGITIGAALHDLGKMMVPLEILSKPGRLMPIEYQLVQSHAQAGYDVLKPIDFPWPIADMVQQHHERLDGTGYPHGLRDNEITLEAKVLAVADVVESMMSHRPYRPGLGIDVALAEIEKGKGQIYDSTAVDACVKLFREKGFKFQ